MTAFKIIAVLFSFVCCVLRKFNTFFKCDFKQFPIQIIGRVVSVTDGDTVKIEHTPYIFGKQTIILRLAGVDCPELAHFGKPEQPLAKKAKHYVEELMHKTVMVTIYSRDRYNRFVGNLLHHSLFRTRNLSLDLLNEGLAVVYHGQGAEYGGQKQQMLKLEAKAKQKKVGVWNLKVFVTPKEHKATSSIAA